MAGMLERIANGDDRAVREVVDEFAPLVWRMARRYLDKVDSEVEDAVQDVFVEIWMSAKRYDPSKGSEASFIATIAHRRLTDAQRRAVTRFKHTKRSAELKPIERIRSRVRSEAFANVAEKFDELPEDERQVLWLSVHRGMTHKQIGDALGTPVGTVKTRVRRGVMRLGRMIRAEDRHAAGAQGGAV